MPQAVWRLGFVQLWHPGIIATVLLVQALYLWLVYGSVGRARSVAPHPPARTVSFLIGMAVLYLAFGTPLDALSDDFLFSAHMVEHLLEIFVLVPLLLHGTPGWLMAPALAWRPLRGVLGAALSPWLGATIFNVIFSVFHLPLLYNLTLSSEAFHFFEHAMFFIGAIGLWWSVLAPADLRRPFPPGAQMIYAFYNMMAMMPAFVLITFAGHPLYAYGEAPRQFGLSPYGDQQLGAMIMFFGSALAYLVIFMAAFLPFAAKVAADEDEDGRSIAPEAGRAHAVR